MSKKTNSWKLGLFVVVGMATGAFVLVGVGATRFDKPSVEFVTYFDESVQGLEVGAKVKFRGVPIGEVTDITIAPDRELVEVHGKVYVERLVALGLRKEGEEPDPNANFVPERLRVQLVSASLATGQKFLQTEFFDKEYYPMTPLAFPTPANYIPSVESTGKSIEELVDSVSRGFPELLEQTKRLLSKIEESLDKVDVGAFSNRGVAALDELDAVLKQASETLAQVDGKLAEVDVGELTTSGQQALDELNETLKRTRAVVERIEKQGGLLEDLEASADSLRQADLDGTVAEARGTVAAVKSTSLAVTDLARDSRDLGRELEEAATAVKQAADSIRRLADTIEREPDMLLKGRSKRDP